MQPNTDEKFKSDPQYAFIKHLLKHKQPVLNILDKIENKTLSLGEGYSLTKYLCEATREACFKFPDLFDTVNLNDCNLNDSNLAILFEGFQKMSWIKKLVINNIPVSYTHLTLPTNREV